MFSAVAGALMIMVNGWFTPYTPIWLIVVVLITGGLLRSMFFTSVNALVFADTPEENIAQATAISAVVQQISIAVGVATAGTVLEAVQMFTGEPIGLNSFQIAFVAVSMVAACAAVIFLRMDPAAGASVSGHQLRAAGPGGRTPFARP